MFAQALSLAATGLESLVSQHCNHAAAVKKGASSASSAVAASPATWLASRMVAVCLYLSLFPTPAD